MSQADNLLEYLTVAAHEHNVIDDDQVFTIDPVTRQISCVAPERNVLVQEDHKSEVFRFRMPRIVEGHDMALCDVVRIAYINIQADSRDKVFDDGVYDVTDLHIDSTGNNIEFSWEVTAGSTQFEGILNFGVIFKCMEGKRVTYRWGSFYYESVYVLKRLGSEINFPIKYLDVIEQWKDKVKKEFSAYIEQTIANDVSVAKAELDEQLHNDMDARYEEVQNVLDDFDNILETEITNMNSDIDVLKARMNTFASLPEGSTVGDAELADSRVGYDGKTYPSSGTASREQSAEVVDILSKVGVYSETVLNGVDTPDVYIARVDGGLSEISRVGRGHVTYDVSGYVGKVLSVSTVIDASTISVVIFADANGDHVLNIPGYTEYYKTAVTVPENASILYVNYHTESVTNNNVNVKVINLFNLTGNLNGINYDISRLNEQLHTFIRDGVAPIILPWEMGWIDYANGAESSATYTNRIRTSEYYKPLYDKFYYTVPTGYRAIAIRYTYDETSGEYTYIDNTGYINGPKSNIIDVNPGDCFRFTFRANPDKDLTVDDGSNLILYYTTEKVITMDNIHSILDEYEQYKVPEYWLEAITTAESRIKNIVNDATKNNNDISMFFTIADPHYPANTGVSTSLMKYLGNRCGIGLTVCLGDIIMDSTDSREEGLLRIQEAMEYLMNCSDRMILTPGNHDTNVQIVDRDGQLKAARIIYDNEWIHHTSSKMVGIPNVVFEEKRKAFYYDDILQGIRFIGIDSFDDKTYVIENGIITDLSLGSPSDRQKEWIRNVALATVPAGYSVVSFSHYALERLNLYNGSEYVTLVPGGFKDTDVADIFKDFKASGRTYIGHFSGHLHHDFVSTKDGITCVSSLNDGNDYRTASYFGEGFEFVGDAPKKTAGTVTECAFDVVIANKSTQHVDLIRIGAGDDRSFDY